MKANKWGAKDGRAVSEEQPPEEPPSKLSEEETEQAKRRRAPFEAAAFRAQPLGPRWSELIALSGVARPNLAIGRATRLLDQAAMNKSLGAAARVRAVGDQSRVDLNALLPKANLSLGLSVGDMLSPALTRDIARASSASLVVPKLKVSLPETSLAAGFMLSPGVREAMASVARNSGASVSVTPAFRAVAERVTRQVSSELLGASTARIRVGALVDLRTQAQRIQRASARASEATAASGHVVRDLARTSGTRDVPLGGDGLLSADPGRVEDWVRGITLAVVARLPARDWTEEVVAAYVWALVWSLCLLFLIEHPLPEVLERLTSAGGLGVSAALPATAASKIVRRGYRALDGHVDAGDTHAVDATPDEMGPD